MLKYSKIAVCNMYLVPIYLLITLGLNHNSMASITGEESILQRITSTWGEMFGSSALHTQTTALGEGIKSCTVGRGTIVTITTRDWQVMLQSIYNKLLQWVFYYNF